LYIINQIIGLRLSPYYRILRFSVISQAADTFVTGVATREDGKIVAAVRLFCHY